jgi:hypothetical protein
MSLVSSMLFGARQERSEKRCSRTEGSEMAQTLRDEIEVLLVSRTTGLTAIPLIELVFILARAYNQRGNAKRLSPTRKDNRQETDLFGESGP